jgi:chemotaxis protein methyltransferase CheR
MENSVETIGISDEELKSLTGAIAQRHGIDFSCYEPKSLKRRIARALTVFKLNHVHELWGKILREPGFIYPLLDEISVGLTAMFRDPVLWKKIRSLLEQEWNTRTTLNLWHAGCSTGEEVFTMGIVLAETKFRGMVRADATDISKQAMATAQAGEYPIQKMEEYEQNYRQYNSSGSLSTYYRQTLGGLCMDQSLIRHVSFQYHNLLRDSVQSTYDIIFCRNVMIYFDAPSKIKLFKKFHQSLNPNGLLVIGFYDAVLPLLDASKFRVLDMDAKIFQKNS